MSHESNSLAKIDAGLREWQQHQRGQDGSSMLKKVALRICNEKRQQCWNEGLPDMLECRYSTRPGTRRTLPASVVEAAAAPVKNGPRMACPRAAQLPLPGLRRAGSSPAIVHRRLPRAGRVLCMGGDVALDVVCDLDKLPSKSPGPIITAHLEIANASSLTDGKEAELLPPLQEYVQEESYPRLHSQAFLSPGKCSGPLRRKDRPAVVPDDLFRTMLGLADDLAQEHDAHGSGFHAKTLRKRLRFDLEMN